MNRSTYGSLSPTPPFAAESRLSRSETVESARRPSKIVPARPPALPTTWTQSWPPLKMTLTHTGHLSPAPGRAAANACKDTAR